jgi:hypothetical protein
MKYAIIILALMLAGSLAINARFIMAKTKKEDIWGEYWKTRMALFYASRNNDRNAMDYWSDRNVAVFKQMVRKKMVIPVQYNWNDPSEAEDFSKFLSRIEHYRCGYSIDGGQWPVGIEYVDELRYDYVPKKFQRQTNNQEGTLPTFPPP